MKRINNVRTFTVETKESHTVNLDVTDLGVVIAIHLSPNVRLVTDGRTWHQYHCHNDVWHRRDMLTAVAGRIVHNPLIIEGVGVQRLSPGCWTVTADLYQGESPDPYLGIRETLYQLNRYVETYKLKFAASPETETGTLLAEYQTKALNTWKRAHRIAHDCSRFYLEDLPVKQTD